MARKTVTHPVDLTGLTFGRLTVVSPTEIVSSSGPVWECRCSCGAVTNVPRGSLLKRNTRSCGCGKRVQGRPKIHGGTATFGYGSKEYSIWEQMMMRCYVPTHRHFDRYGGRGITVCDRWKHFDHFRADMGERPRGLTLERVDNNGGYSPDNCKWATRLEQLRNTAKNVYVEYLGERRCLSEWSQRYGLPRTALRNRLRLGWTIEQALFTPLRHRATPHR